ncbi:hypothetical protein HRW12_29045 [Streptomyces lunaelactis]|uniref:hypothetical protein n=1 Tax=Streptomyces lunaelactis TaxID=1535768 RepID=UPI0015855084|nr:hypothetical protein [Streptomyces lunaelactis]NUK37696.1 hypothetical protein [Streptomyces lunaelactis]NUK44459.1 hypothetical protein [Streptomyces lunaelactis]
MTEQHDFARPLTTAEQPRRTGPRATAQHPEPSQPLAQLAPQLDRPWLKEDTDTPDRTTNYTHPEGHRIGLRLQPGNLTIQTWITAGPDLPPLPAGTAEEKAAAQAANDARVQPGRTWHATVPTRHSEDLPTAVARVVRERLIPALTHKPRAVHTVTYDPKPDAAPAPEPKTPTAKKRRVAATKKKGTQK